MSFFCCLPVCLRCACTRVLQTPSGDIGREPCFLLAFRTPSGGAQPGTQEQHMDPPFPPLNPRSPGNSRTPRNQQFTVHAQKPSSTPQRRHTDRRSQRRSHLRIIEMAWPRAKEAEDPRKRGRMPAPRPAHGSGFFFEWACDPELIAGLEPLATPKQLQLRSSIRTNCRWNTGMPL